MGILWIVVKSLEQMGSVFLVVDYNGSHGLVLVDFA